MADIRTVAPAPNEDGTAFLRMLPEGATALCAEAALARTARALLLDQGHGTVRADTQHILIGGEAGICSAVLHVWSEAADPGDDRLSIIRVFAHLARQREERKRPLKVDIVVRGAFWADDERGHRDVE